MLFDNEIGKKLGDKMSTPISAINNSNQERHFLYLPAHRRKSCSTLSAQCDGVAPCLAADPKDRPE